MSDLLIALAERVEKATGGNRALDALIECEIRRQKAYALGLSDEHRSHWKPIGDKGEVIDHQGITRYHPPTYTFSLDAAMTLVPEGWTYEVSNRAPAPHAGRAYLHNGELHFAGVGFARNTKRKHVELTAATPALALTAAALRALSQRTQS